MYNQKAPIVLSNAIITISITGKAGLVVEISLFQIVRDVLVVVFASSALYGPFLFSQGYIYFEHRPSACFYSLKLKCNSPLYLIWAST